MKSIFACKLYRSSLRKDKIKAALADPVNAELVQQLATYLDEEYQVPVVDDTEDVKDDSSTSAEDSTTSSRSPSTSSHLSPGHSSSPDDFEDIDTEDGEGEELDNLEDTDVNLEDENDNSDISESTNVHGQNISASITLTDEETLSTIVEQIKGTLNMKDDTSGVIRVRIKDSELWIHYNDNVNLNNVMTPSVELLESSGYHYLEFNRLARSENAIVFQISLADTGAVK